MRKSIFNLNDIKDRIADIKGKDIDITISRGRKRYDSYIGQIENTYPSVFTVKVEGDSNVKSVTCSYSDVLCGDVKIVER